MDTVKFFPTTTPFPKVTNDKYLRIDTTNLLAILQEPSKSIPLLKYGSLVINAYIQLDQILKRATKQPIAAREPRVNPTFIPSLPTPYPRVESTLSPTNTTKLPASAPRVHDKAPVFQPIISPNKHHLYIKTTRQHPLLRNKMLRRLRPTQ